MNRTWTLPVLLDAWANVVPDVKISDVTLDSRHVTQGALFLACAGTDRHGLEFAARAVAGGAVAVAWEPAPGIAAPTLSVPTVAVPALRAHSGEIAARFFSEPSRTVRVTGITGTDGKTSTAHLLAQALTALGRPCEYIGTLGSGIVGALNPAANTTPDAVSLQRALAEGLAAGRRDCALEVSSHALDQGRVNGVRFTTTVLTNIGRDHLDYHGDLAHYVAAKRLLFGRGDGAPAILNGDDVHGRQFARELQGHCRVILYGFGDRPPSAAEYLRGSNLETHADGVRFEVAGHAETAVTDSALLGRFNAYNLLAATAVLVFEQIPLTRACAVLSTARTVPGRAEAFRGPRCEALVVVDYAHTPQALTSILQALRPHTRGKLVCVFGCGGERDRGKRPLMTAAVANNADSCIITDDNPRGEDPAAIVADMLAGLPIGADAPVCHDRAQAIRDAVASAQDGDVVLVAGKGHENYQIYGNERRAFSDRALVAELVGMELTA